MNVFSKPTVAFYNNNSNLDNITDSTTNIGALISKKNNIYSIPDDKYSNSYNADFLRSLDVDSNKVGTHSHVAKETLEKYKHLNAEQIYNLILDNETDLDEMRISLLSFRDKANAHICAEYACEA